MKMEINVRIKNADGTEGTKPVVVDTEIPEFDEFTGPDNFREVFDKYEKAVLKVRNEAAELATDEYLTAMSKKADLALLKTIVAEFGQLSRRELAATVCENLSWRAPNGRLKINGCRLLMEKMHAAGLIVLPPKRSHS